MHKAARVTMLYLRTASGQRAWESASSGLPLHYRRILGLIGDGAAGLQIAGAMAEHAGREVQGWLDELETLCFVERKLVALTPPAPRRASGARRG